MYRLVYFLVLACFFGVTVQRSTPADDSYVAAVLEYQFQASTNVNLQNYLRYIQEAAEQNADIIVFPELSLTRGGPSMAVPMVDLVPEYLVPALYPDLYDEVLVAISEAARLHQIYVLINFEELMDCTATTQEYCPENQTYRFNTNAVFDRNGAIIDRYRKINLFVEGSRTASLQPDLGMFTTDFGVTFGHYISFDQQFQIPSFQVVEKFNITDVIVPAMWFSALPYLTAVQIQEAYAYAQNINFLGAGANNIYAGSAGSGIYSGKAGALASTMPGVPTTRLLVSRVPKVPGQVTAPGPGPIYDPPSDLDSLVLITDPSLPSHVTRLLAEGPQEFSLTDREVTCHFKTDLNKRQPGYIYRASAFSGVRTYSGITTGGIRICSIFACTGNNISECGKRFPQYNENTTAIFNELSITATVPTPVIDPSVQARSSGYFPVSVNTNLMPLEPKDYSYSEDTNGNLTVYTFVLNTREAQLYSFAVWGRNFAADGQEVDPPRDDHDTGESGPDSGNMHQLSGLLITAVLLLFYANL